MYNIGDYIKYKGLFNKEFNDKEIKSYIINIVDNFLYLSNGYRIYLVKIGENILLKNNEFISHILVSKIEEE